MKNSYLWMILGICFFAAGCGKPPEDSGKTLIKVATWDNPRMMSILEGLAKDYEKMNPNLVVRIRQIPYGEYLDRLTASQPASLLPDVLLVSTGQAAELYSRGMLENLKNVEPYQGGKTPSGYDPNLAKAFSFKGQLYAMPRDLAPVCLVYYNKSLFDAAHLAYPKDDWDWNKFLESARALTRSTDAKNQKQVWGYVEDWAMAEPWVYSSGCRWVKDEMNPIRYTIKDTAFLPGIRFREALIHKEKVMPSPQDMVNEGQIGGADLFLQGQAGMLLSGPWKAVEFNDHPHLKWGVAVFPKGKGGLAFQVGGSGWGLLAVSEHSREALDLLRFLSSQDAQERYTKAGLALPALAEVEKGLGGFKNPALTEAAQAMKRGKGIEDPRACNWPDVRDNHINPILERVWTGEWTPEKAVENLEQDLKANPLNMNPPQRKPPAQNKPQMFLF